MPVDRIPFGEWKPDLGEWEHDGLYKVYGAIRTSGKWVPAPAFIPVEDVETVSQALTSARGMWLHAPSTGTEDLYIGYGSGTNIRIASIASATTYDAGSTFTDDPGTGSGCQMTSYGNYIYYVGGYTNSIARATHNSLSTAVVVYATPDSYNPKPKYISTIKNHLLIGNMKIANAPAGAALATATAYPELVMWSATDNPLRFGDPSSTPSATLLGADYQQLADDGGPITGIVGGDYAYIFKPRSVWRMDGPPWQFRPVVQGIGTIYPNSIINLHDNVYFWGPAGPTRIRQGYSEPMSPGAAKSTASLTDKMSTALRDYLMEMEPTLFETPSAGIAPIDISGIIDHRNGLVGWVVGETAVSASTTFYRYSLVIVYDTHTDEISAFYVNGKIRMARSIPKIGSTSQTTIWAGATTMPHALFDGTFAIGSVGSLSGGVWTAPATTTATKILTTYGDSTAAVVKYGTFPTQWAPEFIWPYVTFGEDKKTTRIKRVRIPFSLVRGSTYIGDGDPDGKLIITVKVNSRSRGVDTFHQSTGTYDSSSATCQNADNWIDIDSGQGSVAATHHQLDIKFEAYDTLTSGKRWISHLRDFPYVEVEFTQEGTSSSPFTA
jgi:hypothetical protein